MDGNYLSMLVKDGNQLVSGESDGVCLQVTLDTEIGVSGAGYPAISPPSEEEERLCDKLLGSALSKRIGSFPLVTLHKKDLHAPPFIPEPLPLSNKRDHYLHAESPTGKFLHNTTHPRYLAFQLRQLIPGTLCRDRQFFQNLCTKA
jgi:hypothetical protein